jgi:hypothetical protein
MMDLFNFVVLLAIFLLQPMSNSTNKPTHKPMCKPTNDQINDQTTNQTKQRLEQDALLPLLSSIHQCNKTCNAFQMIAYLDFNQFSQNSVEADSDFRDIQHQLFNIIILDLVFSDFQHQLFINIEADSNFSQFLSLILHQTWHDHQHLVSFVSHLDSC